MTNNYSIKDLGFGKIGYTKPCSEAVMGLAAFGQLLVVPYKDSAAGSNPREFQGMKSATNKKILESLLKNQKTFWALHSGVTITVTSGINDESAQELEYEDACLTNGLQTVTIARILAMIKAYQEDSNRSEIHTKINRNMSERLHECITKVFSPDVVEQLSNIKLEHVNSVLNWLSSQDHAELRNRLNTISLKDLLDIKVSVKIMLLDNLVTESIEGKEALALEKLGYDIAEANNETQKVEAGDLFGSHNQKWLKEELFKNIQKPVVVEYRRLSEDRSDTNQKIVHVLDLLRAILPTTLIIDDGDDNDASFVANYANRREPIYNWFDRVISIHRDDGDKRLEIKRNVGILKNLMPDLVEMIFLVQRLWDKQRKEISFKTVNEWYTLKNAVPALRTQIFEEQGSHLPKQDADNILKKYLGFSFANVFTIFVYATRRAIEIDDNFKVVYSLPEDKVGLLITEIYRSLAKERLTKSILGSTSELFRNPDLYINAEHTFNLITKTANLEFHDYIHQYQLKIKHV
jgi:hypothetical protein